MEFPNLISSMAPKLHIGENGLHPICGQRIPLPRKGAPVRLNKWNEIEELWDNVWVKNLWETNYCMKCSKIIKSLSNK